MVVMTMAFNLILTLWPLVPHFHAPSLHLSLHRSALSGSTRHTQS